MDEKVWIVGYNWIFVLSLIMTGEVKAACTPTPDCASIGYTETSCETDYLACPFDSTKLKCMPCDSSFKYSCTGENIKNPIGVACNNKYVACECEDRTTFVNGECIRDPLCDVVGNIMYSDGSCSENKLDNKTPVGIIAYKDDSKHLIISLETNISLPWSTTQKDAEGNSIITYSTDLAGLNNYSSQDLALSDSQATGKEQTLIIVEAYGENATGVAAVYCYNYAPEGYEHTKGQWYLPATGELYDVVFNNNVNINKGFAALGMNSLNLSYYWSSSESARDRAWLVNSGYGDVYNFAKLASYAVSCLLAI